MSARNNDELMHQYIEENNVDGIKEILKENRNLINEIEIEYCDSEEFLRNGKFTPLSIAIQHRYLKMIEFLLAEGANVNQLDGFDKSPLIYALEFSVYDVKKEITNKEIISIIDILFEHDAKMRPAKSSLTSVFYKSSEMGTLVMNTCFCNCELFTYVVSMYVKNDDVRERDLIRSARIVQPKNVEIHYAIDRLLNKNLRHSEYESGFLGGMMSFFGDKRPLNEKHPKIQNNTEEGNLHITNDFL